VLEQGENDLRDTSGGAAPKIVRALSLIMRRSHSPFIEVQMNMLVDGALF
jgi:hypothetical protein